MHYELFLGSLEELIKHGLRALRDTLPAEVELTNKVDILSHQNNHIGNIWFVVF